MLTAGISPEQEVVTRHFSYFGPVPEGLYRCLADEQWKEAFKIASRVAHDEVIARPELRLRVWGQEMGTNALDMLADMLNLDPAARLSIDQVLDHRFWKEALE